MLSNNEMRKYINRISFRSLLKTSLSHQVPYHDLYLAHHYSTIVIDIMNHLQTNEQKKTEIKQNQAGTWHRIDLSVFKYNLAQDPWRCRLVVQRKSSIPREGSTWYDSTALSRCTIEGSLWKEGACLHFRCEKSAFFIDNCIF